MTTTLLDTYVGSLGALLTAGADADPDLAAQVHRAYLDALGAGLLGATTPGGLPYPVPTDPVAGGADAIRALAEAVDATLIPRAWRLQTDSSSLSVPTAVWTKANTTTAVDSGGTGTSLSAGGINITQGGVYAVDALAEWGTGTTGTRIMGVGLQTGSGPDARLRQGGGGPVTVPMVQSGAWTTRYAAGTVIHLWVYQNSGANISLTTRELNVRRVDN